MTETKYRICSICEATCGLEVDVDGREIIAIRGNKGDVFSEGYICPKGFAMKELDADPDRLRKPLVRRSGELVETSWEEAFAEVERRIMPIMEQYGRNAVGLYLGNPSAHKIGLQLYLAQFSRALGTINRYSASTLDQMPKQVALGYMYGNIISAPIPDIDRSDLLVIMGGNPMASNGSLWTVPDFRGRVKKMQKRGGRVIVIDPKRTQTAKIADDYIAIRPGTDPYLLAAMAHVMIEEGLVSLGHLEAHLSGLNEARAAVAAYPPEAVTDVTGIPADRIRDLARDVATTEKAGVYGRMGTCTVEFGTLASWLVEVVNILAGNVDREGGMMFPKAPAMQKNSSGTPGIGRGIQLHKYVSRVRGAPEVLGEFPAVCLPEEIETEGEGQVRALFTVAGNPLLSVPAGDKWGRALGKLDFMVSVDIYLNETTKNADVILPGTSPFEECQFDIGFAQLSIRNNARFSPAMFPPPKSGPDARPQEWEIMMRLATVLNGGQQTVREADDALIRAKIASLAGKPGSLLADRDPDEIFEALEPWTGPERQIDLALRAGPYGEGFGANPNGLTLQKLIDNQDGIDLGPLAARVPELLRTPTGMIEMAPPEILDDLERMHARLEREDESGFLLIGRRDVRTNNSWLHNLPVLAKGPMRCTMQINPDDALALGLEDGDMATVSRKGSSVDVETEVTEDMMAGVISIPHGFGHDHQGANLRVAAERPGVNSNLLADDQWLDPLSGTSVLNGIPVEVRATRVVQAAE